MTKKIYSGLLISLGAVLLIDLFWPDHHHVVFPWHSTPGFDTFFGFVGCLALMIGSLSLGEFLLWRTTCSVLLTEEMLTGVPLTDAQNDEEFDYGQVAKLEVGPRQQVKEGDTLAVIKKDAREWIVKAPMDGTVAEIFSDVGDDVRLGETIVNLRVPKDAMHHDEEETADA